MKRFLLALVALVAVAGAQTASAQVYESRSYVKKTTLTKEVKAPDTCPFKKCQWYVRAGVGLPATEGIVGFTENANFDLDFGFQRRMGCKGWYWGMDFAFVTRSFSMETHDGVDTQNRVGGRWNIINFGWRKLWGDWMLDVHAGLALTAYGSSYWDDPEYYDDVTTIGAEFSIPIGIGARWKKLILDFTVFPTPTWSGHAYKSNYYDYGTFEDNMDYATSTNMVLSIGYAF